jgi:pilus assembly protein TadC
VARFFSWILIIPLGAGVVAFTVSNRGRILIDLWPAPISFEPPIFAAVFVAAFGGFLLGGIISFISASRRRSRDRQLARMLENAKREEASLREQVRKLEVATAAQPQVQTHWQG